MKQLEVNTRKDVTISDLVCSPNVILLAKQRTTTSPKGEVTTTVRYIEVCGVEKTDKLAIVQNLLKFCVAEFYVCNDLERDFAGTNIKQQKLFNQFLSGDTIYRTDSTGKVSDALISEVPLRRTALNVKDYHTITTCKPENRKAAIYQHAKAILAQCAYRSMIIDKAATIDSEQAETPTETPKKPGRKRTRKAAGATLIIPTAPAIAAAPAAM